MVIQIFGAILAIVIAVGIIMALMVWKKNKGYRIFLKTGIIVISASIVLMVVSFLLQIIFLIGIPILALGIIYLIIGMVNRNKGKKFV
ncbi:hypothetical protein ACFLV3_03625 [Chloroflexota bacterium]